MLPRPPGGAPTSAAVDPRADRGGPERIKRLRWTPGGFGEWAHALLLLFLVLVLLLLLLVLFFLIS